MSLAMMGNVATLLLILCTTVTANLFADFLPQDLSRRSTVNGGGFSLSQGTCPPDLQLVRCGSEHCCPSSLSCVTNGILTAPGCCPQNTNCLTAIRSAPFCADNTWALWNSDKAGDDKGYFCCLSGQIGLKNGGCVDPDTAVASTLSAVLLSSGSPATSSPLQSTETGTSSNAVAQTTSKSTDSTTSHSASASSTASSQASTSALTPISTSTLNPTSLSPVAPVAPVPGKSQASAMRALGSLSLGGVVSVVLLFAVFL